MLSVTFSHAQTFESVALEMGVAEQYVGGFLGGGVSFCDFDKDGWDDVSFTQNGSDPVFYHNVNGIFTPMSLPIYNEFEMKQITWVDFDNDGDRDLFTTSMFAPFRLYENDGAMQFTEVTETSGLPWTAYMTFGNSWGDYDRDGFLDVYISTYDGPFLGDPSVTNYLFRNNGDGTFTDRTIETGLGNGSNYTFMSLWLDYDNDLWPDLFVINDRLESANYLYHNNGDGTFTDVSIAANMNNYIYAMCNSGDDYDNDGDLDVYITNSTQGNLMKRNNGDGTFSDAAAETGTILNRFTWAAQFIDADNDTWQDLHICSTPHIQTPGQNQFLKNNGGVFMHHEVAAGISADGGWSRGSAMGDINNDGFPDLAILKNSPDFSSILKNTSDQNHWMKVTLEGVESNRDGISSWIECYTNGQKFVRYTYCGESYLCQNSTSEFFGLAENEVVDSLIVRWTSGIIDTWYHIPADQSLYLVEGTSTSAQIHSETDFSLCENESLSLYADDWQTILWSTGETGDSIYVSQSSQIHLLATDPWGNQFLSDTVNVVMHAAPTVIPIAESPTCHDSADGSITLTGAFETLNQETEWNGNIISGYMIDGLVSGTYVYHLLDLNHCPSIGVVELIAPDMLLHATILSDAKCYGENSGQAVINLSGGTPGYLIDWTGLQPDSLYAGQYSILITDAHGCEAIAQFQINEPPPLNGNTQVTHVACNGENSGEVIIEITGGTGEYIIDYLNENPDALIAGVYNVLVTDDNSCSLNLSYEIFQPEPLQVELEVTPFFASGVPGHAIAIVSGGTEPYTLTWTTINGMQADPLELQAGDYVLAVMDENECDSSFVFHVDFIENISDHNLSFTQLYPNPTTDLITLQVKRFRAQAKVVIYDATGKQVDQFTMNQAVKMVSLKSFGTGIYFVHITDGYFSEIQKVVVHSEE